MKKALFLIAAILIIAWAIILTVFSIPEFRTFHYVHLLFMFAVIFAVIGLIVKKK
jgi:hypothetical protein